MFASFLLSSPTHSTSSAFLKVAENLLCPLLPHSLSLQSTMLQAIERYMKQAIVDKVPSVSSSALVSSLVCSCGRGPAWLGMGVGIKN